MGQFDTGQGLGLGLIQQVNQRSRKGGGQLCLTVSFLGVETQLQHAAVVPVPTTLQVFKHTTGVAEAADDHLRQRGAMRGKLEVQHALRVARSLLGQSFVTLQQGHLPAAFGQAVGAGASREPGANY